MKSICLQAGHINAKNNVITSLRTSTGAPGEQELTKRITDRLSSLLRNNGFEVKQTDACANSDKSITSKDWDLFLAIHGDADTPGNSGGTIGVPDPKSDGAALRSAQLATSIREVYFSETGIKDLAFTTSNILKYYMWKYLSAKTPCVLIELGQVQDPHDKVLLANTDLIANALAKAVCTAFGTSFNSQTTPPPSSIDVIESLKKEISTLKTAREADKTQFNKDLAQVKADCQVKLKKIIKGLEDLITLCK